MLTHIVWWTLKPEAEGLTAARNADLIKERLYALKGVIPSLKNIRLSDEVSSSSTEGADLVLLTEHDDAQGLADYATHPEHRKIAEYIGKVTSSRRALDFTAG